VKQDENDYKISWWTRNASWFFLLVIILTIISPILFTKVSIFKEFDFTETGQIGDTIGGITAPIINLFAAFLVFLAFREQVQANLFQYKALKKDRYRIDDEHKFNYISQELNILSKEYIGLNIDPNNGVNSINSIIFEYLIKEKPFKVKSTLIDKSDFNLQLELEKTIHSAYYLKSNFEPLVSFIKAIKEDSLKEILATKALKIHQYYPKILLEHYEKNEELINEFMSSNFGFIYNKDFCLKTEDIKWLEKNSFETLIKNEN
jgi:hypothetical protein